MLIRNGFRTPDDFFVRLALPETPLSARLPADRQGNDGRHLDIRGRVPNALNCSGFRNITEQREQA
jgi:hypothetical protein